MPLQIVPGSEVRSNYGGTQLNAAPLLAVGGAKAAVGSGLQDVSNVLQVFGEKMQAATNTADIIEAQNKMQQTQAAYSDEMATNQDEQTWVPGWQKNVSELKTSILDNGKLAPDVREHLQNQLSQWESTSTTQIATQANVRSIQRQKARLMTVADDNWKNGDFDQGKQAIDAMVGAGLVNPDEAVDIVKAGRVKVDVNNVNRGIGVDPIGTFDALNDQTDGGRWRNFTALDENQRESLKVEARRQISAVRVETVNDLVDRRNSGEIIGTAELQKLVDGRKLNATQMRWILQEQARSKGDPGNLPEFSKLLSEIDGYDKTKDPTNEKFAELTGRRMALPPEMREEAQRRLDAKLKPDSAAITGSHEVLKYVDELLDNGAFGPVKGTIEEKTPGKFFGTNTTTRKVGPEDIEKAYGQAIELKRDLQRFMQANPNADSVTQRDYIDKLTRGKVNAQAATPLLNAISGTVHPTGAAVHVTSQAQRDALAPGTVYIGPDGVTYTRK